MYTSLDISTGGSVQLHPTVQTAGYDLKMVDTGGNWLQVTVSEEQAKLLLKLLEIYTTGEVVA